MMSKSKDVWAIFPSGNPEQALKCCALWRGRGYKTAVRFNQYIDFDWDYGQRVYTTKPYDGYYRSIRLILDLLRSSHVDFDWVVCIGDDLQPSHEMNPDRIAAECTVHFNGTYGVMQPIGDGAFAMTCFAAVSPWIGRQWIEESYQGNGPHWQQYYHDSGDLELQQVAMMQGVFWNRPDLTQYHAHYLRGHKDQLPPEMRKKISDRVATDKRIFRERQAPGFPGSERLIKEPTNAQA